MLVLFVFGFCSSFMEGDILHDYAFARFNCYLLEFIYFALKRLQKYNHPKGFLKLGLWWYFTTYCWWVFCVVLVCSVSP